MRIRNKKTGEIKEVSIKELNQYGLGGSVYVKNKLTKLPVFMEEGGAIVTNRGQWDYPGQTTIIPSNEITMQGVPYPVLGVDNLGNEMLMQPEMDYTFPGQYVTEYPMMQKGGLVKYQTGRLVKFNPYENVNRVSSSDGTKVFRLNPEQVENAKKAAAIRNEKIVKEYQQNQRSFIGPDKRTKAERDKSIAARKAYDELVEKQKVMSQQPFYQTLQSTTAGGNNPNAAYNPVIGNTAGALGYTAAGALLSPVVRPAINFMGEAMNAPIQGIPGLKVIPGLTGNNIVNSYFATHGLKSIMDGSVAKPWREARKTGNPWDYANAVNENLITALELSPLVGPGYRGALEAGQLSKKGLRKGVDLIHPVGRTLKQIEKEGLANGLSLQEIKKLQLDKVGITSLQREGYFPGVSEIVTEYITPYSYENAKKRILDIPRRIIKGEKNSKKLSDLDVNFIFDYEKKGLVSKPRYDAFRLYAGLPQKNNTFRIAETVPINHPSYSAKQLNNLEKFSLNEDKKLLRSLPNEMDNAHLFYGEQEDLIKAVPSLKKELERIKDIKNKGIDYAGDFNDTGVMGGYNRRYFDNKMEYNDIWDLDLNGLKVEKYFGKPFLSHGQLNYSFEPAEKEINRLIRDGEYYSNNIIKPKPRPKYLDDIDNYTNNFFKQLNQKQFNQKDLIIKNKKQNGGLIKYQTGRLVKFNPYQKTTPIIDRGNFAQHYTKPIVQNVWINPKTGLPMTKDEAEMSKAQQIAQNQNPGSIRKTVPVSAGRRALDIVSNPMTAAQQAIAKQPITGRGPRNILDNAVDLVNPIIYAKAIKNTTSNVVHPIETLKKLGNAGLGTLQYITEGSTNIPVGEGYGVLFDGLMTAGALKSAKPFLKTPLSKTGEYLTTQTPLKNIPKINPWRFKENPDAYYRGIGEEGLQDVKKSGVLRVNQNPKWVNALTGKKPDVSTSSPYFFRGDNFKGVLEYDPNIIVEVTNQEMKSRNFSNLINTLSDTPVPAVYQPVKQVGTIGKIPIVDKITSIPVGENTKFFKKHWLQGYKQIKVPKQSIDPKLGRVLNKQGFINPVEIVDRVVPRINPFSFITGGPDVMSFSPLNLIPGYGKKLSGTKNQAFRKFGNSIQDVAQRKALSPAGGSKYRMGRDQIVKEGNWAALENPWEQYPGVFEATFDKTVPNNNLSFLQKSNRNGVLITDAKGNFLPEIPLTEPGMQLNRRLPFSTRYVPINKQKLIDGEFQLATQLPHLQSLAEKYGILAAGAGGLGYFVNGKKGAKENIKTLNKYTIDPIIKLYQKADKELNKGPKIYYKNGGQLKK